MLNDFQNPAVFIPVLSLAVFLIAMILYTIGYYEGERVSDNFWRSFIVICGYGYWKHDKKGKPVVHMCGIDEVVESMKRVTSEEKIIKQ